MADQSNEVHVYRISAGNKAMPWVLAVLLFCFGIFIPFHDVRLGQRVVDAIESGLVVLPLFVLVVLVGLRSNQMHITITDSQVEFVNLLRRHVIPFTEIRGRRNAGRGMYLYRKNKPRVYLGESSFKLDEFYTRWVASIYDFDKADLRARKLAGKPHMTDWFFDDSEQHPTIGGPDTHS